ncbi:hypothetical protein BDF20DRAFT_835024 [Mycotypha africana]|uniref:uncharacterized protein n=1 Tax=Mycotypha africana TaxID=64632 RepID=UPI002301B34A|nr:uncharacterized protein BDF20DRAFT_835024 [Mycotypha africana]KAI8982400.1 hypothetical protein BDF20DRAFT_835024 [Mycotypha africana]
MDPRIANDYYPNRNNQNVAFHEKTEASSAPPSKDFGMITPPVSPVRVSMNSNLANSPPAVMNHNRLSNTNTMISKPDSTNTPKAYTKPAKKPTAGQTGLPWLTHDADGEHFSSKQLCNSPTDLSVSSSGTNGGSIQLQHQQRGTASASANISPPPKFRAKPRTLSAIGFPTRKRTMQKYIYSMKDGLEPVKILCKRLTIWQDSVKFLIRMFKRIRKVELNTGKGYRKIDDTFDIPAKLREHFKSSNGVQDAWAAFKDYTRENSLIHEDFVDFINSEIVPILHVMLKDIYTMIQSLKSNRDLYTAGLWDCRKRADKDITTLNSELYKVVNSQEKAASNYLIPKKDPLLIKYVVIASIRELYQHENQLHKSFLNTQDMYRQFEQEKIINVYTDLFTTFETFRVEHHLETLEGVNKMAAILKAIETDSEYWDFVQHHENQLVKTNAAFKDEHHFDFPNATHPLVQPLMEGTLQRHYGKKWHDEYYILSPVGMLYKFRDKEHMLKAPLKSELSLFVPRCTLLIDPNDQLAVLKGKLLHSFLGSKKSLELSSTQPDTIKLWINALDAMVSQRETGVIKTAPPQQQPQQQIVPDNHSFQSKVQTDEEQPVIDRCNMPIMNDDVTDKRSNSVEVEKPEDSVEKAPQLSVTNNFTLPPIDTGAALSDVHQNNNKLERAYTSSNAIIDSHFDESSPRTIDSSQQLPQQQQQQELQPTTIDDPKIIHPEDNNKFIPVAFSSSQTSNKNSINEGVNLNNKYNDQHSDSVENTERSTHAPMTQHSHPDMNSRTDFDPHQDNLDAQNEVNDSSRDTISQRNEGFGNFEPPNINYSKGRSSTMQSSEIQDNLPGPNYYAEPGKNEQSIRDATPNYEDKIMPGGPMRQASDVFWNAQ